MKIAFVGKGGSGKTTLSSLFARHLAAADLPVLAIDADINQHLGVALGLDEEAASGLPALGERLHQIKEYLRGDNPRIRSASSMTKTTPPGRGSKLLRVVEDNPIYAGAARQVGGARLMVTGPFSESDLGVACYHSKVGAAELLLNHLVDGAGEYVVVDMTAGADSFASGMFTRFDVTFLICEPTRKGVSVYRQYRDYARDHEINLRVVGNKVQGSGDVAFLRAAVGDDLLVCVEHSAFVRAMEQGRTVALDDLEGTNATALERMREAVDATEKDWEKFTRQAVEIHRKNSQAWANSALGEDLSAQIDPSFVLGPEALAAASAPSGQPTESQPVQSRPKERSSHVA